MNKEEVRTIFERDFPNGSVVQFMTTENAIFRTNADDWTVTEDHLILYDQGITVAIIPIKNISELKVYE